MLFFVWIIQQFLQPPFESASPVSKPSPGDIRPGSWTTHLSTKINPALNFYHWDPAMAKIPSSWPWGRRSSIPMLQPHFHVVYSDGIAPLVWSCLWPEKKNPLWSSPRAAGFSAHPNVHSWHRWTLLLQYLQTPLPCVTLRHLISTSSDSSSEGPSPRHLHQLILWPILHQGVAITDHLICSIYRMPLSRSCLVEEKFSWLSWHLVKFPPPFLPPLKKTTSKSGWDWFACHFQGSILLGHEGAGLGSPWLTSARCLAGKFQPSWNWRWKHVATHRFLMLCGRSSCSRFQPCIWLDWS